MLERVENFRPKLVRQSTRHALGMPLAVQSAPMLGPWLERVVMGVAATVNETEGESLVLGDVLLKRVKAVDDAQAVVDRRRLVACGEGRLAGTRVDAARLRRAGTMSEAIRVLG